MGQERSVAERLWGIVIWALVIFFVANVAATIAAVVVNSLGTRWFGAWLPAGAAPEIMARLQSEIARALQEPDVQKEFDTLGLRSVGSSPEEFARFVAKEAAAALEIARRIEGRKK